MIGDRSFSGRHQFGDTRYRRVRYRLRGTSRFGEYFAPKIREDPKRISLVSEEVVSHVTEMALAAVLRDDRRERRGQSA